MPRTPSAAMAHLLRRAGFGAAPDELTTYLSYGLSGAVQRLVNFEQAPDTVDALIGTPGYAPVSDVFTPNVNINHARQRWLFRMLYSKRPLQEKMALFWHNHFATGHSKINAAIGDVNATRLMAAVSETDPVGQQGQIETFRRLATGNFFDLLVAVATDPAMLIWLDGRSNFKARPQENFGRELMELFTIGLIYTEADVKSAARVFTGWNLKTTNVGTPYGPVPRYSFVYNPGQHDISPKQFTFPIYDDTAPSANVIPARDASDGYLDGYDLLLALAAHPATGRRLARKLYAYFVSDTSDPPADVIEYLAGVYQSSLFDMRAVVGALLSHRHFYSDAVQYARFSWPVDHAIQPLKALGAESVLLSTVVERMTAMGMNLYDPVTVEGWKAGKNWFTSTSMLARMNYGQSVAANRKTTLVQLIKSSGLQIYPDKIVDWALRRLGSPLPVSDEVLKDMVDYMVAGFNGTWSSSDAQLNAKLPGLVHLILGSSDYQFV